MASFIKVRGAREHNLANVDVDIPRNSLVVITGLSGSGKSSLAFDTIYAEGQRRYVESLSAYARQFLEVQKKPDVDLIEGLSPAISIEQKTSSHNPRSTVGTATEIYDYMRLLWARTGIPYSPVTGLPIESQTVSQIVDRITVMPEGSKIYLLSPIARGKKGEFKKEIKALQKKGFGRVKVDGKMYEIEDFPDLNKNFKHDIYVVVDRLAIKPDIERRLADSVETALNLSDGLLIVENAETHEENIFSSKFACPVSGFTIEEIEPRLFSFNNPHGACPECDGLGVRLYVDPELVVPDKNLSLRQGAFAPAFLNGSSMYEQMLESICEKYGASMNTPFKDLPEAMKQTLFYGSGNENITIHYDNGYDRKFTTNRPFEGVINNMERRFIETDSNWSREEISRYQSTSPCESCHGAKLCPEALAIKVGGLNISEASEKSIVAAKEWFLNLEDKLREKDKEIARRILREINERLGFLNDVGLGYLTLGRASATLSGGESQRIRLASQIGSGLTGVLYVLDEPSIGLHQRDNDKLLEALEHLKELDNTVIVVEHDEDAIRHADYVIDIGASAIVKGIRNTSDFDYEYWLASINRSVDERVETVFLPAVPE
ncbi:MAG: excinuclease ABC subunit UvrA, partial [Alphaproteobacteria bacterium]|nr:excinuclease ABC subunit UvrA [Alphaproteobacteria bacterium]